MYGTQYSAIHLMQGWDLKYTFSDFGLVVKHINFFSHKSDQTVTDTPIQ